MTRRNHKTDTAVNAILENQPKDQSPLPFTVSVSQACQLSGLGPTTIWKFINDGRLDAVRIPGIKRTLIRYSSLVRLLTPAYSSEPTQRNSQGGPAGTVSSKSTMEVA
jgi:hypothetical protein